MADGLGQLRVVERLGGGGQGSVYLAETPELRQVAVKWYSPEWSTPDQAERLAELIRRGSPDPRFLWPFATAHVLENRRPRSTAAHPSFGYVMPLCESGFVPLARLVNGELGLSSEPSYRTVITMCLHLVESFRLLHAGGLCYRDVSLANLFFDPAAGDIRICDVDNVGVDDGTSKVLGTPLFMAPEIVRDRTYRTFPSRRTDLHSLAVILFMLLFMEHPLIGRRVDAGIWDDEHSIRHFGADPLFIFSPDDDSNRPRRRHAQQYWRVYPEFLKRPMLTAFGIGLNDPAERVTEGEWIRVLTELRDSMASCPGCGNTVFYSVRSAERETCAACGTSLPKPLVLAAGRRRIVVSRHLAFGMDFLQQNAVDGPVIARAVSHPADHRRLGLKNVSGAPWRVTTAEGSVHRVNPQEAVDLLEGLRVTIGGIDAVVVGV